MAKQTEYGKYLQLDSLLNLQHPESAQQESESHDETLFIITHQVYELWFKQILHELDSIIGFFSEGVLDEHDLFKAVARQSRIIEIQKILVAQLTVMETMTAMDFLEFRDLLIPASGFQSVQFRQVEIKLGLSTGKRCAVDKSYFLGQLPPKDRLRVEETEKEPSLFVLIQKWLERMPFTSSGNYEFWCEYQQAVNTMLAGEERILRAHGRRAGEEARTEIKHLEATRRNFDSLFNQCLHETLVSEGLRRFSRQSMLSALFILLYREEPVLQLPFNFLTQLMDIDEHFTAWRNRHGLMAHRMLGRKVGTGGSSGHEYLKKATDTNRFFVDLFNLSTFLLPRSKLPQLPEDLKRDLDFHFKAKG